MALQNFVILVIFAIVEALLQNFVIFANFVTSRVQSWTISKTSTKRKVAKQESWKIRVFATNLPLLSG